MKLLFKQRSFSWLDSYDVFDENQNTVFTVKGVLAIKHAFKVYDAIDNPVGMIRERVLTLFRPSFDLVIDGVAAGSIIKNFTLLKPKFTLAFRNWQVTGNWQEWDYQIQGPEGTVATIAKRVGCWPDTYEIDVVKPADAVGALMVVIAIDAAKSSQR